MTRHKHPATRPWTFLLYMCGDNHLEADIKKDFEEIRRVGSVDRCYVVAQVDTAAGARRYVLPPKSSKGASSPLSSVDCGRVNTGDPKTAIDFFLWGIEHAPSDHVAIILSGLGISPEYVREHLAVDAGRSGAEEIDARVLQKLFTICHDRTAQDALEAHELRAILEQIADKRHAPVDLVGLDMGAAAFVEIAYQMERLAHVLVASQRLLPDDGWPYQRILSKWQTRAAKPNADAHALGRIIVDTVADAYPGKDVSMAAVNLDALDDAGRVLDTMALALMQHLGDWHVFNAVSRAGRKTDWITTDGLDKSPTSQQSAKQPEAWTHLPAVDLFALLKNLQRELVIEGKETKSTFGQRARIVQLGDLVGKALDVFTASTRSGNALLLHTRPKDRGLSILLPPTRDPMGSNKSGEHSFQLADSNYLDLRFAKRVHWAALLGAFQLISEKPHVLWRLVSSMLSDANGSARDELLRRLISPDSVIEGLKGQFQSLDDKTALTLSLDSVITQDAEGGRQHYRLRLESAVAGAIVAEHKSRVFQPAIDATLGALQQLLQSSEETETARQKLESFGRSLGEDILQDLADRLLDERSEATRRQPDRTPHLRLQIPAEFMRYPWELISDRQGMLSDRYALGRQVFMEAGHARRVMQRKPGPIEVLVIGDPQFSPEFARQCEKTHGWRPRQLPGAQREARMVINEFDRLGDELLGMVPIRVTPLVGVRVTVNDVRQHLRSGRFDIIHYAGHAYFDKKDAESSAWLLSDAMLRAREIRNTLAWTDSPPWLVFANACEAGMDAGASAMRYHSDVFGLATAFINQAVAAYIAPLWPVDDQAAAQLAVDFYRALLLDRASLGEALRFAKSMAKDDLLAANNAGVAMPARSALSWASVVLYGDPTPRLLESLWTPHAERAAREMAPEPTPVPSRPGRSRIRMKRLAQATAKEIDGLIAGPGIRQLSVDVARGIESLPEKTPGFELVEINGIRVWQIIDPNTGQRLPLPGSELGTAAMKDSVRGALGLERGFKDYLRVIGRWVVGTITGDETKPLIFRLVEQFDRETVAVEQLLHITSGPQYDPLPRSGQWGWLDGAPAPGQTDRVLLIIHGTFSKTESPINGLGEQFLDWARQQYRGVIGYNHWTLSKSPEDNAKELWERLDPRLRTGHRLDIITHSRGGLVARALIELGNHDDAVRRLVFVGTPNSGTDLANPDNWGRAADVLINLAHADPTGFYGRLSGLFVQLLVRGAVKAIPGLHAQNPTAQGTSDFLRRLQSPAPLPKNVSYAAIAANYEPERDEFNLKRLLSEAGDATIDAFFGDPNDLVVDTAHVWSVDATPNLETVGPVIPAHRILIFNPDPKVPTPPGVLVHSMSGVHHTNLFTWPQTRDFLRRHLA
ncbi:MAG: CHAT domain-containing protein [Candidatus Methylomirabilis oxygeniifera]|uniref:Uncharacterized protein n=1 Tax=Methylomirabilis oxygeniifera TaxID=671143 RepID=D5MH90_METO1|nr:MAG: CHAT domain-containing protein [Candidatus Methylomirabilis oxyfera]CBE69122.1 protein of unknown function [Candidatus Methylomirabilis oxyfera]